MIPGVSAGSNQVGASVVCTPQVSWPSGPAAKLVMGAPATKPSAEIASRSRRVRWVSQVAERCSARLPTAEPMDPPPKMAPIGSLALTVTQPCTKVSHDYERMLPLPRPVIAPALGRPSSAGNNKLYRKSISAESAPNLHPNSNLGCNSRRPRRVPEAYKTNEAIRGRRPPSSQAERGGDDRGYIGYGGRGGAFSPIVRFLRNRQAKGAMRSIVRGRCHARPHGQASGERRSLPSHYQRTLRDRLRDAARGFRSRGAHCGEGRRCRAGRAATPRAQPGAGERSSCGSISAAFACACAAAAGER